MATEKSNQETPEKVRVLVDFQPELYEKFQNSVFRRESNTDGEGVRSAIKHLLSLPDIT
jgi:metal-responsive CopG/Arc/MetJ family transcriptional regulator